jgi:starvation-inducible DNA-binding protein
MLAEKLKVLLASSYAFTIKAQNFHWNVEGPDFSEYHKFFGKLYEEVYDSLDYTAEYIRILESYTPGSLQRFKELSIIPDQLLIPRAELMFAELLEDNERMLGLLHECFEAASEHKGIENFLAERIDAHGKHGWMLKSTLKKERA